MKDDTKFFVKYGGIQFQRNASKEEINQFVNNLPDEKRESLSEVTQELRNAGLIRPLGHFTTIDEEMEDEQETYPEMNPDPYA